MVDSVFKAKSKLQMRHRTEELRGWNGRPKHYQSFIEYVSVEPLDGKTKEIKVSERNLVAKGPIAIARTADCSRVTIGARW